MPLGADDLRRILGLAPLQAEGGWFRETHRAALTLAARALPATYAGPRPASTAIYYMLTPDALSALHRLRGDEVYHFYLGDPVQMLQLHPAGAAEVVVLGTDLEQGMRPQVVVPGGVWQGSRLIAGGSWALLGTTMAPGFDVADFEIGHRDTLAQQYPACAEMIAALAGAG